MKVESEPHSKMKVKSEPLLCVDCAKTFPHSGSLSMHVLREHREKKFLCGECTEAFVFNYELVRHTKRKHVLERVRPYMCDTCGKSFYQRCELARHQDMHKNEKYFCTFCPKYFSHSSYLDTHTIVHTEEKPICVDCDKTFSTASYLRSHRRNVHGIIEPMKKTRKRRTLKSFECTECSFIGRQARDIIRHNAKEHTVKPEGKPTELPCEFCSQWFPRKKNLNEHRRTIHCDKLIACQHCPMRFSKMKNLKKHLSNSCTLSAKLKDGRSCTFFGRQTKENVKSENAQEVAKETVTIFSGEVKTKEEIIEHDTESLLKVNIDDGNKEDKEEASLNVNIKEENCKDTKDSQEQDSQEQFEEHSHEDINSKNIMEEEEDSSSQENIDPSIFYDVLHEFLDLNSYATPKNSPQ